MRASSPSQTSVWESPYSIRAQLERGDEPALPGGDTWWVRGQRPGRDRRSQAWSVGSLVAAYVGHSDVRRVRPPPVNSIAWRPPVTEGRRAGRRAGQRAGRGEG